VVHILRQACRSLAEAHQRNLIHRDIKPANIYLCEHAFEHDFVKVLDFGLVKRLSTTGTADEAMVTQTQALAGTPAYIAPELALGREPIDGRADIYSLGCVAFWLLTGRRVFEENTSMAMIVAHTTATPPRPSSCTGMPIPPELDALVLACLQKDPVQRTQSAEELATRLEAIEFESAWTDERAGEWWRMHQQAAL
jgi:serine/threonine-protein kinase